MKEIIHAGSQVDGNAFQGRENYPTEFYAKRELLKGFVHHFVVALGGRLDFNGQQRGVGLPYRFIDEVEWPGRSHHNIGRSSFGNCRQGYFTGNPV